MKGPTDIWLAILKRPKEDGTQKMSSIMGNKEVLEAEGQIKGEKENSSKKASLSLLKDGNNAIDSMEYRR